MKKIISIAGGVVGLLVAAGVVWAQQLPYSMALTPLSDTNEVGDSHTVTAVVTDANGNPVGGLPIVFGVIAGPNSGASGVCSPDSTCATSPVGNVAWTYTGSGGVGTDQVMACFFVVDQEGNRQEVCITVEKNWVDPTPRATCEETVNPHGKTVPPAGSTTLPGSRGGQNEDGFYELTGTQGVQIWITDAFGSGPFGPFLVGDKVKITEAPGGVASQKKIGSSKGQAGAVAWHITLLGDPILVDGAGNVLGQCLVPPPPK